MLHKNVNANFVLLFVSGSQAAESMPPAGNGLCFKWASTVQSHMMQALALWAEPSDQRGEALLVV